MSDDRLPKPPNSQPNNQPSNKPTHEIDVDPATLLAIVTALLLIPLLLSGFFLQ
ncbi:MAG: hypothetical protein ACRC8A_12430 [Microcoleaceae cyanobacterium]